MKKYSLTILLFSIILGTTVQAQEMKAHFISIDQADATLLEFSCGVVLVDAGAQVFSGTTQSTNKLINYLDEFFTSRPELNKTINSILITHNHNDHTESLDEISKNYTVKSIVSTEYYLDRNDDVEDFIKGEPGVQYKYVTYKDAVSKMPNGMYYKEIDPFDCDDYGPKIKIFTGKTNISAPVTVNNKKFYKSNFYNPNNQSLVIKVEYGEASFIFTGDLQKKGIEYLLGNYEGNLNVLEADVYQVGHHGSHNATTTELLEAFKPKIAVISAGHYSVKKSGTAWDHGHPNKDIIEMMDTTKTLEFLPSAKSIKIFKSQNSNPLNHNIERKIYCTCWEDDIIITANAKDGSMKVSY